MTQSMTRRQAPANGSKKIRLEWLKFTAQTWEKKQKQAMSNPMCFYVSAICALVPLATALRYYSILTWSNAMNRLPIVTTLIVTRRLYSHHWYRNRCSHTSKHYSHSAYSHMHVAYENWHSDSSWLLLQGCGGSKVTKMEKKHFQTNSDSRYRCLYYDGSVI